MLYEVVKLDIKMLSIYICCFIGIIIIGKFFIVPIKLIIKLLLNSMIGIILLYIINLIGAAWGLHIGINVITSIFVGLLGIPGVILLAIIAI